MELFFTYLFLGALTAHFIGRRRQIGFLWSLCLCSCNILLGLFATLFSPKSTLPSPAASRFKQRIGWAVVGLGCLALISLITQIGLAEINAHLLALGLIIMGFYLVQVGKGQRFDQ